jgi:anti-sigma-K factor RskA
MSTATVLQRRMNVREYISSGAIESYVLGLATEAERQELEALCAQYPEIAAARAGFEQMLEAQLLGDAVPPPAHLKNATLNKIKAAQEEQFSATNIAAETPVRRMNPWKWVGAASLILLAGAAWWAFNTNQRYNELKASNEQMQQRLNEQSVALQQMKKDEELIKGEQMKMAAMHGTSNPAIYSTIYWDTLTKDVYLMVNNLPKPASDKQYQLWALLNGQPIDLGVVEARQERLLYRMKNVQDAQAFAITLEPKGGSASPTMPPVVMSN